jgi:uncharacterized protein YndB with AHSA1/START domain
MNIDLQSTPLLAASLLAVSLSAQALPDGEEPILRKEILIQAPLHAVWNAWTTEEGLSCVSQKSNIELKLGGPFELFLQTEPDERGRRGSEGSKILAFLPQELLAFDWTFPPSIPSLRYAGKKTQVIIRLEDLGAGETRVRLAQLDWGQGEDWDAGYAYFDEGWEVVLERMKTHLEN